MKTIYNTLLLIAFIPATTIMVNAQCDGGRYTSQIFSADSVTSNIQYGNNTTYTGGTQSLLLDVYQPSGDTASVRPLIIMAHGGSFLFGSKTGGDVVPFCHDFAKMGYVVASINYRLGITGIPLPGPDSVGATEAVMRGVHDGKAAVRFFRKSAAASGNPYRIDTNHVYFGGVSAGAIIALHMAYLDDMSEYPSWVDSSHFGLSGGLEGTSGNPGYSSEVNAIVNICGAVRDTAWIHAGDEPVCSFHGPNDQTVPYGSAIIYLLGQYPMLQVDGSFSIAARMNQLGIANCFETYEGQDHVPHTLAPPQGTRYYDTTKVIMRNFLAHFVCGNQLECNYTPAVGIEDISNHDDEVLIYPNPANREFTIYGLRFTILNVEIFNLVGKKVFSQQTASDKQQTFNVSDLPPGIYLVKVFYSNGVAYKRLIKE